MNIMTTATYRNFAMTVFLLCTALLINAKEKPWDHGDLTVSDNGLFFQHTDGTPFFWLGDTGWLLPQRLDRDEAEMYLANCAEAGFNVVQIQVLNGVPSVNRYGRLSNPDGWNMSACDRPGEYGYWDHMDHIVDTAERHGIYIGMVCIWGGLVKSGKLDADEAAEYGRFLAERYGNRPNIIWITGGDIQGDVKPDVWDSLARAIKRRDSRHLLTFHPRGRTTSARWWADAPWLDFHMFQSGHRRYGQRMGNKDYPIPDGTEEDCWMYVDSVRKHSPVKPVLDGEPSYEDIPQGLHSAEEPVWGERDVRRYAYWSVFAGSCGHTYGHNNIMQFARPGIPGAYFADCEAKPWYRAIHDPGRNQMKYLKRLMLALPYAGRIPDQSVIIENGSRYDRLIATRGDDYLLVYNHTARPMHLDLSRISGKEKNVWVMKASDGTLRHLGKYTGKEFSYTPDTDDDIVLIAIDSRRNYLTPYMTEIPDKAPVSERKDLTE